MVDYATYVSQLENTIAEDPTDSNFQEILPAIINYAEMRIYRELDLISTITRDTSTTLTSGDQNAAFSDQFVTVQGANLLTPAGQSPSTAKRNQLIPVAKEVLYTLWGDPTVTGQPTMYAMVDQWTALVGPTPDDAYGVEVYGTIRPEPLSEDNPETFLTTYLYDLFFAASMIFVSGWMRNFSSSGSDPNMPVNWETQYGKLFASANVEELRKKDWSVSWTAFSPTPLAQPDRG